MEKTALNYAKNAQELCVLPDVYLKLKEMLMDEKSNLTDIANIISLEPALASSLLRIANSSLFNFPREIDSIAKAINILGRDEVNNLIDTYGVTAAFSGIAPDILDINKFWEISVDCSLLTKYLAKKKNITPSNGLFLSALLHNIGVLAMVHSERKKVQYCENYDKEETPWQRQKAVFGFTFADCSVELLTLWQLPESIINPIREFNHAFAGELQPATTLLYITSRLAVINSHPGLSKIKELDNISKDDLSITMDDINEALNHCNAEGMSIMAALNVTG